MEAALAAKMVAIHLLTMKVTAFAIQHEYDTGTAATAGKLARTQVMARRQGKCPGCGQSKTRSTMSKG